MNYTIEILKESDMREVISWWADHGVDRFSFETLNTCQTFLLRIAGVPALCVTMIATRARIAWIEAFAGNPAISTARRRKFTPLLLAYLEKRAKIGGAKKLFCMSPHPVLTEYYEGLGFVKTASVDAMIKEIK